MTPARYILPPSASVAYNLVAITRSPLRPRTTLERAYLGATLATALRPTQGEEHVAEVAALVSIASTTRAALRGSVGRGACAELAETAEALRDLVRDRVATEERAHVVVAIVWELLTDADLAACVDLDRALTRAVVALGDKITDAHHRTAARLMAGLT